jgi:hypothetical protein
MREQGLMALCEKLRKIEPSIVLPQSGDPVLWETKRRIQHAFQCALMLTAAQQLSRKMISIVDIGGTGIHTSYLSSLLAGKTAVSPLSVNIDAGVVEKIRAQGQPALNCRGEELHTHLRGRQIDIFVAFETIEHLHNPAVFLRRLAKHFDCSSLIVSVPYLRQSRVGLFNLRQGLRKNISAGDEHLFELNPHDWELLMLHSGWRVRYGSILYQYPRSIPLLSTAFSRLWRNAEFEGFWGAILEKDMTYANYYQDWEE